MQPVVAAAAVRGDNRNNNSYNNGYAISSQYGRSSRDAQGREAQWQPQRTVQVQRALPVIAERMVNRFQVNRVQVAVDRHGRDHRDRDDFAYRSYDVHDGFRR
jgi:hypothetical protein